MQESISLVGREVERLITAPYAPSFQDLYNLVHHTSPASLRSWASHKPCQVRALVDVLVDGLSRSSFALHLIGTFASVAAFRNDLLERSPCLLDECLRKAIEDDGAEYIPVCTALLSSPLPADFIAPARLAPFVMKLISTIGDNPCAEKIHPVYQIMTGLQTSPGVLHEINSDTMSNLQAELTKTLRNLDDHMGNLLCLASFARIASSQKGRTEGERGQQIPTWLQNIRHFFGPKRGLKTLDLVVLRVILACSASCKGLMADQAAESIKLGIEICRTVEETQRVSWIQANSSKIAKLCEKVSRDNIDPEVQVLGITFLISLLPAPAPPSELPEIALHWVLSESSTRVLGALPLDYISLLAEAYIVCSKQSAILDYVIAALNPKCSTDPANADRIQVAHSLVVGLQNMISPGSNSAALEASLIRFKGPIDELMKSFPRSPYLPSCQGSTICYGSVAESENDLLYELFSLYFQPSLSPSLDQETQLVHINSFRVFMSKARNSMSPNRCSFFDVKPLDLRGTFPSLTIRDRYPSARTDWRNGLAETIMAGARMSHANMMQKVEEICYDLERRCDSVEAPLRAVEEERNKISLEAEDLKRHNGHLMLELQQASSTIAERQQCISRLEIHAETASARIEELTASFDAARSELEDQRRAFQDTANRERESARTRELDLIASMAEKEEQLDQLQEESNRRSEESDQLRTTLNIVSKERDVAVERNNCLEQDTSRLGGIVEEDRLLLTRKDEEIERLQAAKEDMETLMDTIQSKLNEEVSESENIKSALHEAETKFETQMASLREQFELQLSKSTAESVRQKEEIAALQDAIQAAASTAAKELQTKEKRLQYLEKKVQHLRDERAAKTREFTEAQQHIGRLMAVMGWKPDNADSKTAGTQPRPRSRLEPSQVATMQQQMRPSSENTEIQSEDIIAASFESDASNFCGRSPKRSRNTAFPAAELPASSQHIMDKKSRHPVCRGGSATQRRERTALADQPSSQGSSKSFSNRQEAFQDSQVYDGITENRFQGIDLDMDLELSKDFIFTSTSLSQANGGTSPQS